MNILVLTAERGRVVARPDTTWEKDNNPLYLPDFVNGLSYSPVFFARVCKPGRSVGLKFAERYYDHTGYGVLLYPEDMLDGSEEGYACASCLDHTSFLPYPVAESRAGADVEEDFNLFRDDSRICRCASAGSGTMERAIAEATRYCYIRTGDFIAVELEGRRHLCSREDGECRIYGGQGRDITIDFNIIF